MLISARSNSLTDFENMSFCTSIMRPLRLTISVAKSTFPFLKKKQEQKRRISLACVLKSLWSGTLLKPQGLQPAQFESHHLSVLTETHPNISLNFISFNITCSVSQIGHKHGER